MKRIVFFFWDFLFLAFVINFLYFSRKVLNSNVNVWL